MGRDTGGAGGEEESMEITQIQYSGENLGKMLKFTFNKRNSESSSAFLACPLSGALRKYGWVDSVFSFFFFACVPQLELSKKAKKKWLKENTCIPQTNHLFAIIIIIHKI